MWQFLYDVNSRLHRREENTGRIFTSPQDSENGSFIFPRTWPTNFRETSTINISWSTNYEGVNLYYYQQGKVAESIQIATNLAIGWLLWEVETEEANLTDPFVFRIVNARGTVEEQANGGFWSTSFFIIRGAISNTITSSTLSTSATTPIRLSPEPTSSTTMSTSSPTPSETIQAIESGDVGLDSGIIAGISIGAVLGAAVLAAMGFWYCRRRARDHRDLLQPDRSPKLPLQAHYEPQMPPPELYTAPPELYGSRVFHELPGDER